MFGSFYPNSNSPKSNGEQDRDAKIPTLRSDNIHDRLSHNGEIPHFGHGSMDRAFFLTLPVTHKVVDKLFARSLLLWEVVS